MARPSFEPNTSEYKSEALVLKPTCLVEAFTTLTLGDRLGNLSLVYIFCVDV
jgi:hypothetical protein